MIKRWLFLEVNGVAFRIEASLVNSFGKGWVGMDRRVNIVASTVIASPSSAIISVALGPMM